MPRSGWTRFAAGVLLALLVLGLQQGCSADRSGNPHGNWVFLSEETERGMGRSAAERLEQQVGLYRNDALERYLDNVGSRIAVYSDRSDLRYRFRVLDIFVVNALALPGGYVYVTRGLMRRLENEAQLAGVLAHEIAHVAAYHAVKRTQLSVVSGLAAIALATQTEGGAGPTLLAREMITRGYTRSAEGQADQLAVEYLVRAGYDPRGLRQFLTILNEIHEEVPTGEYIYMRTHPYIADRVREARELERQHVHLLSGEPILNPSRFHRHVRQHLFTPREEEFLRVFNRFLDAYRRMEIGAMQQLVAENFQLGDDDHAQDGEFFWEELRRRFSSAYRIDYEHNLMTMDVGSTDATVLYEYDSKIWFRDQKQPQLRDGRQAMVWRRRDHEWKLIRLR